MTVFIHFWRLTLVIWSGFCAFVAEVVEKCFEFFIVFGGCAAGVFKGCPSSGGVSTVSLSPIVRLRINNVQ